MELDEDVGWYHRLLGDAYRDAGRVEKACAAYLRALELDPEDEETRRALDSASRSGNPFEAHDHCGRRSHLVEEVGVDPRFGSLCSPCLATVPAYRLDIQPECEPPLPLVGCLRSGKRAPGDGLREVGKFPCVWNWRPRRSETQSVSEGRTVGLTSTSFRGIIVAGPGCGGSVRELMSY